MALSPPYKEVSACRRGRLVTSRPRVWSSKWLLQNDISPPPLLFRVAEKEPVNKMSLHNLATVFGPTLLRPSEVESKAHLTSAADIWSHDVMAQVPPHCPGLWLAGRGVRQAPLRGRERMAEFHTPFVLSSWVDGL